MVIIKEDNVPCLQWPIGRIVKVYRGADDLIRVVDVKTSNGVFSRPIHRLAPLLKGVNQKEGPEEDDNLENQNPKNRAKYSSSSLTLTILIIMLLLPCALAQQINITEFDEKPGIYYEKIGTTKFSVADWNVIVYYDLNPYWKDGHAFSMGVIKFGEVCGKLKNVACPSMFAHFKHAEKELLMENELLEYKRIKRAPLDIVGNIANSLFGVLDSQYAKDMADTIKKVKRNENYLIDLFILKIRHR